jgi:hypothetical protein
MLGLKIIDKDIAAKINTQSLVSYFSFLGSIRGIGVYVGVRFALDGEGLRQP